VGPVLEVLKNCARFLNDNGFSTGMSSTSAGTSTTSTSTNTDEHVLVPRGSPFENTKEVCTSTSTS
jgi:hypothetical protein